MIATLEGKKIVMWAKKRRGMAQVLWAFVLRGSLLASGVVTTVAGGGGSRGDGGPATAAQLAQATGVVIDLISAKRSVFK